MHKSILILVTMVASMALVSGCARWSRGDTGAVLGGVAGAAVGHQIGSGTGQTIATVAGAIVGSMLGRRVGQNMSQQDRVQFGRVLSTNPTGQTAAWNNANTGNSYTVTPISDSYASNSRTCRQFQMAVQIQGQPDHVTGTACRQPGGNWSVQ